VGTFLPLCSTAAMSESLGRCLPLFFFFERLEAPSLASSSCLALPRTWSKIALIASSPEAWLVAMSRSSLVV
jgi:hypothetical protein